MQTKLKARCERVRVNGGIVEVLFTREADMADAHSQEQHVLVNLAVPPDRFIKGKFYWITIDPAFPHKP